MLTAHGSIFLRQSTNQGRAAEWCSDKMEKVKSRPDWKSIGADGFVAGEDGALAGEMRRNFERSVEKARAGLRPVKINRVFSDALDRMVAEVRAAGAEPILFLSPSVEPRENYVGLPEGVTVWNFRDPNQYPELFHANDRYDPSHLNRGGAEVYTNLLADRFVEHLRTHR
jgi:hypothetical protein